MDISEKMKELKRQILTVSHENQEGHIPTAFSILDILYVLYNDVMNVDPENPKMPGRDRLVVSKGHASIGMYAVMADRGYFPKEEVATYCKFGSRLGGHPDRNKVPGIEVSTGSLGHGFPLAIGIAMGMKINHASGTVYVIAGDGEMNEGTMWESVLLAKQHNLSNLVFILDYNHSGDRAIDLGDMQEKFKTFGWETISVDGHDHEALTKALVPPIGDAPKAVIANTIKGYGCPMIENNPAWHHRSPNDEEYKQLMEELA